VVLTGLLVACGGSDTAVVVQQSEEAEVPSATTARSALDVSLSAFNEACVVPVRIQQSSFPVTVIAPNRQERSTRYRELNALASAGVLTADTTTRNLERLTFRVSDAWQDARKDILDPRRGVQEALCYATPRVTAVDTIKAIEGRTTRKLAEVVFRYTYSQAAAWAQTPEVKRAFPKVRAFLQRNGSERRRRQTLVATDDGWVDVRLRGASMAGP
jgi:hypothetical protein